MHRIAKRNDERILDTILHWGGDCKRLHALHHTLVRFTILDNDANVEHLGGVGLRSVDVPVHHCVVRRNRRWNRNPAATAEAA